MLTTEALLPLLGPTTGEPPTGTPKGKRSRFTDLIGVPGLITLLRVSGGFPKTTGGTFNNVTASHPRGLEPLPTWLAGRVGTAELRLPLLT